MTAVGGIELERTVESIRVGRRHRCDLGDLDALAASIDRDGLLQPPTITPDGVLVCGARRLAAIKLLGWRTVNVWVRSGISDRLGHLLAEQDDNQYPLPQGKKNNGVHSISPRARRCRGRCFRSTPPYRPAPARPALRRSRSATGQVLWP